ncbi:hypothetical protein AB0H83_12665 [Dactylosporangium sp. NPDC050688]|uniref:hypothetical protein n=1 Tax=Dactylosporangium sp. NPDC050688 TaxID=3157217 RepID=UPI0034112663
MSPIACRLCVALAVLSAPAAGLTAGRPLGDTVYFAATHLGRGRWVLAGQPA